MFETLNLEDLTICKYFVDFVVMFVYFEINFLTLMLDVFGNSLV